MEVCEKYEMVTMLFSDIVTFTVICSRLKPLQVSNRFGLEREFSGLVCRGRSEVWFGESLGVWFGQTIFVKKESVLHGDKEKKGW